MLSKRFLNSGGFTTRLIGVVDKLGVKTLYYHNTRDGASDAQDDTPEVEDDDCAGGACKI